MSVRGMVAGLALLSAPAAAEIPYGTLDRVDAVSCGPQAYHPADLLGLAYSLLDALQHTHFALESMSAIADAPKGNNLDLLVTTLTGLKRSDEEFRCAEQALAPFNQPGINKDYRNVALSLMADLRDLVRETAQLQQIARHTSTISEVQLAEQLSSIRVAQDKALKSIGLPVQLTLMMLENPDQPNAAGMVDRLRLSRKEVVALHQAVTDLFPGIGAEGKEGDDVPTIYAAAYLALLDNKKASDGP